MAIVKPFKAVRAKRDKTALVICKTSELYTDSEVKNILDANPYSFLHVVNPAYKYSKQETTNIQSFRLVHNRYLEFKEDHILVKDEKPSLYIYKKITTTDEYIGIIGAAAVEDYKNSVIKKHEDTLEKRENIFSDYLKNTEFNAEPVLLTYPDNSVIEAILNKYQNQRAEYEFATSDKTEHLLWVIDDEDDIQVIENAFKSINAIYIADGHHRCASACLLAKEDKNKESYQYFMSYFISESNLKISEFNRFIKDLNGLTPQEFLIELDSYFRIQPRGQQLYSPTEKHHFSMYLDGEFYSLYLRNGVYEFTDTQSKLDAEVLYRTILQPILGIDDIRNDARIAYEPQVKDSLNMKNMVDNGNFKVSFGMVPNTIEELKEIADSNLKMPPKSTFIEPKLLSALTIYEF